MSMKWVSAIATEENLKDSVEQATRAVLEQLDGLKPHLTVIFVSTNFKQYYEAIPGMIQEWLEPGLLLGCSGAGIIGAGLEVEHKPAFSITAAHLPGVKLQSIYTDTVDLPDQDTSPSVWRDWLGVRVEDQPHFIFLADPFSFRGEEFLAGVDFAYPESKKVGGLASGAHAAGGNARYLGDQIHTRGVIGIALSGDIGVDTIVAQGCRPIGRPMKITRCENTLLQGLDGAIPMNLLQELHDSLSENDRKLMQTSLFLGIEMDPFNENPTQGDFLIRNLMGADRETGAISIGAMLREGQLVQFHLRDKTMSAEDLDLLLTRYRSEGKAEKASGALLFSCLGRGQHLYGCANHDTELFRSKLGDIPLGGFFCNGEIGPVGGTTFLHGYTSSFGIFRPARIKD
jgi:small ligand-binding sensory domain FIST